MILPIVAFGDPVLKEVGQDITEDHPNLQELISNMKETMYNANGIGLAAPQIGIPIRLFTVDTRQLKDDDMDGEKDGIQKVFINATMLEETGKPWSYEEGCLSIPGIRENVTRKDSIEIEYLDENFEYHKERYNGLNARVIQHEYDHIEGILFTDHIKPLRKRLLKRRLSSISKGDIKVPYRMKFPVVK